MCGAVRSAFLALPPLARDRSACILPEGHAGLHSDLAGATWFVTPEVAEAVAVTIAAEALRDAFRNLREAGEEQR
jgi:hypothetical protein